MDKLAVGGGNSQDFEVIFTSKLSNISIRSATSVLLAQEGPNTIPKSLRKAYDQWLTIIMKPNNILLVNSSQVKKMEKKSKLAHPGRKMSKKTNFSKNFFFTFTYRDDLVVLVNGKHIIRDRKASTLSSEKH